MSAKEYRTASSARGGLLTVADVPDIAFGDRVHIRDQQGNTRNGQVIRSSNEEVLIQVFEGTAEIDLESTWVRFL
ncbi:MAG: V-type ATP synthase subunit B, partial [Candidatus Thiodiazotropha sp.]